MNRSNVLIVDEYRLVPIEIINTVLRKFQTAPRQPKYLNKPEYAHLQERNKEIYLSSAGFKSEHAFERVESYTQSMNNGKSYFVCSLPYQLPIKESLLMREQVEDEMQETTFNELSWYMEMESLFYGQSLKSIFKFEELQRSKKVGSCFYPKEVTSLVKGNAFSIPKKDNGEIRVMGVDVAIMAGKQNDATAITVARLIPKTNGGYTIKVVYLETLEGVLTSQQALRIKQLYHDMNIDTIVIDKAGAGMGVVDALLETTTDTERGLDYDAMSCINNEEIAKRCLYPDAKKVIYTIHANADLNSKIALNFKNILSKGKLELPMNEDEGNEYLSSKKAYADLTIEQKHSFKMPYVHSKLLVNEIINLEAEINSDNGQIKLKESSTARKDRYSSISYLCYYVVEELERRKKTRKENPEDLARMFMMRKPKSYR